jgi:hypothetical protein
MKKIYLLLLGISIISFSYSQTTVTIIADRDNSIYSESNTLSNGSGQNLFTGTTQTGDKRRALIHFNLSTIPANSIINSVSLSLYCNKVPQNIAPATIELHRLLKDWGEGTSDATGAEGTGAPATINDATWSFNFYNTSSWTTPGGDFVASRSASAKGVDIGTITMLGPNSVADVQSFVNNSATNFGWIIHDSLESTTSSARRYAARTNANPALRPQITVTYTANLPVTLKTFSGTIQNNQALLSWQTVTELNNQYYEVEHSSDGINFTPIGKVNGIGTSTVSHNYSFTQSNLTAGKHYYRLAQHDADGSVRYSQIILLSFKSNFKLQLIPNPATSTVNITAATTVEGLAYTISSSAGQIVKKGVLSSQQINIQNLLQGQYWLSIETAKGETIKAAFIKK